MTVEARIAELGVTLPEAPRPVGSYTPTVRTGNLVFVSGQMPMVAGKLKYRGKVGKDLWISEAQEAARVATLNALACVKAELGSLDEVVRIVRVIGYVNSAPRFNGQSDVLNGASDLLVEIFGDAGRHTRAAIGVYALPLRSPIEIEMIVEVRS